MMELWACWIFCVDFPNIYSLFSAHVVFFLLLWISLSSYGCLANSRYINIFKSLLECNAADSFYVPSLPSTGLLTSQKTSLFPLKARDRFSGLLPYCQSNYYAEVGDWGCPWMNHRVYFCHSHHYGNSLECPWLAKGHWSIKKLKCPVCWSEPYLIKLLQTSYKITFFLHFVFNALSMTVWS